MIVLDTNVVSELMRDRPDARVLEWIESNPPGSTFTTSITVGEIAYGFARLPEGKRKRALAARVIEAFDLFDRFTLPFDSEAASVFGPLAADHEREGRPIASADAQIAAICLLHDATLATRNAKDFAAMGVQIVDPWGEVTI